MSSSAANGSTSAAPGARRFPGMRVRGAVLRLVLLMLLALGVAVMHHVPGQHAQPPVATTAHAEHPSPAPQPEPAPASHELLHLCLAVAVGFLVLLVPRLRLLALVPVRAPRVRPPAETSVLAPPTPRRLAELCVLRR